MTFKYADLDNYLDGGWINLAQPPELDADGPDYGDVWVLPGQVVAMGEVLIDVNDDKWSYLTTVYLASGATFKTCLSGIQVIELCNRARSEDQS